MHRRQPPAVDEIRKAATRVMEIVKDWFRRHFSDPDVMLLAVVLILGVLAILFLGQTLAPVIAAVVIAYLLDGPCTRLRRLGLPNVLAVIVVWGGFVGIAVAGIVILAPLLSQQVTQLAVTLPDMTQAAQMALLELPDKYPGLISREQLAEALQSLRADALSAVQGLLVSSLDRLSNAMTVMIYAVLVPVMVFFFLKDKAEILTWLSRFLPTRRTLVNTVWAEVNLKTGSYVRGKVFHIIIIAVVSWATYAALDLKFAVLLGLITGLSVVVPYFGAAAVAVPLMLVAYFQFGLDTHFLIVLGAYAVLQALDGNVLVPLLFSNVVKLHPNAIILAVLVFGSFWGFWGLFFAIPLATVVHAVLNAWPRNPALILPPSG
ncbi:AI-2E family transporter [Radicibacter daui]|uniref:AI-2E family transporter n=1 Tax=Radicibacter daui TaxID=3064829 RepID=UPI004046E12F